MREHGTRWRRSAAARDAAARLAGARRRALISVPRLAATVADKQRLLAIAAALGGAPGLLAAVDLESAAFAERGGRARPPWLILRAVSDTAAEALPPLLNRCLDDGGADPARALAVAGLLRAAVGAAAAARACAAACAPAPSRWRAAPRA